MKVEEKKFYLFYTRGGEEETRPTVSSNDLRRVHVHERQDIKDVFTGDRVTLCTIKQMEGRREESSRDIILGQ